MVGKPQEELKFRSILKEKLQVTNVPDMKLVAQDGAKYQFSKLYEFHKFLGTGSFGFVISATHKENNELVAMKVSKISFIFSFYR